MDASHTCSPRQVARMRYACIMKRWATTRATVDHGRRQHLSTNLAAHQCLSANGHSKCLSTHRFWLWTKGLVRQSTVHSHRGAYGLYIPLSLPSELAQVSQSRVWRWHNPYDDIREFSRAISEESRSLIKYTKRSLKRVTSIYYGPDWNVERFETSWERSNES